MKLLILLAIVLGILIYKNLDWIAYMWKEHVAGDFPEDLPPFCFDCNEGSCHGCPAHQAYLKDPKEGWKIFCNEMKYNC